MKQEILLGDAYELVKSVPDGSVDFVFTDPPYLFGEVNYLNAKNSRMRNAQDVDTPLLNAGINSKEILPQFVRVLKKRGGALCGAIRSKSRITSDSSAGEGSSPACG